MNDIVELSERRLFLLANSIELDGRVSWYPDSVRGFAPVNAYMLVDDDSAVLVDTGVRAHRDALLGQIRACLPGEKLSIAFTRIGEYHSICNTTAIAESIPVDALYALVGGVLDWVEFRPRAERGHAHANGSVWAIGHAPESRVASIDEGVPIGTGGRRLHVMMNPVRLLPSQWFFDDGTRTLFTGDVFSHAWRGSPAGPWIVDADAGGVDPAGVRDHLLGRLWWLAGAQFQDEILRALEAVFERYEVETIAPGYGCVIHGRREVERHYEMLRALIGELARSASA